MPPQANSTPPAADALHKALTVIHRLEAKVKTLESRHAEPIAIVGTACRFPGSANSPERFWELLRNGVDAIADVPNDRWDRDAFYDPDPATPGKMYCRQGGFIDDPAQFDPLFFGISPREAERMDPQQRLLLEVSWEALENAGIVVEKNGSHSRCGIFMGVGQNDYAHLAMAAREFREIDGYDATGNASCFAAGRLSHVFGSQGPCVAIDTACSSSLVAIHLACQSLRATECDLALAGGVQLLLSPYSTISLCRMKALAADGRCKTFDASADGYGRGEGCGVLVLRRLQDAQAANDPILAVIRGSAVNHDGPSSGLTVPNGKAQEMVIRQALTNANVAPAEIDYIEAHGTGTLLGDPLEIEALAEVFGRETRRQRPITIGAVKANIGHLEPAAGVAGVMKVVLALEHREIPPQIHLRRPNPHIPWEQLPFTINASPQPWLTGNQPRRAGVSSFGLSGTNAHIIVEEPPARPVSRSPQPIESLPCHILTLSAKTKEGVTELAARYRRYLDAEPPPALGDLCYSTNTGRAQYRHRAAVVADSIAALRQQVELIGEGQRGVPFQGASEEPHPRKDVLLHSAEQSLVISSTDTQAKTPAAAGVVFVFPGNDGYRPGMARQLYETQPDFRAVMDQCGAALASSLKPSLVERLYPSAGAAKKASGRKVTAKAARDEQLYEQCATFAVELGLARLWQSWSIHPTAVIAEGLGEVVAACVSGGCSVDEGIRRVAARAIEKDTSSGADIDPAKGLVNVGGENVGASTGSRFRGPPGSAAGAASYIMDRIRAERDQGAEIFLELSPGAIITPSGECCLPSLDPGQSDWESLLSTLAVLYDRGITIDWTAFYRHHPGNRIRLPNYPFQRRRYWFQAATNVFSGTPTPAPSDSLIENYAISPLATEQVFATRVNTTRFPYLGDHRVYGQIVVPGAFHLALLMDAAAKLFGPLPVRVENILFPQALVLADGDDIALQLIVAPLDGRADARQFKAVSFDANPPGPESLWTVHATGHLLLPTADASPPSLLPLAEIRDRCSQELSQADFYLSLAQHQIGLGSRFQWIDHIRRGDREMICQLQVPSGVTNRPDGALHPCAMDSCFQSLVGIVPRGGHDTCVPYAVRGFRFYPHRLRGTVWCYATLTTAGTERVTGALRLMNPAGEAILEIAEFEARKSRPETFLGARHDAVDEWLYTMEWRPQGLFSERLTPSYLPDPARLREDAAAGSQPPVSTDTVRAYIEEIGALEKASVHLIVAAFRELGWEFEPGQTFTVNELADRWGVPRDFRRRLLQRLLGILAEESLCARDGQRWTIHALPASGAVEEELARLQAQCQHARAELQLLAHAGWQLAAVLRGQRDGVEVLFPDGDLSPTLGVYRDSIAATVTHSDIRSLITTVLSRLPAGRGIRILEIGAGTGGLTSYLLPILPPERTEYTFTDLSPNFTTKAKERFATAYPFVRYRILDIERSPEAQEFTAGHYDVVIAANVLHATQDLAESVRHAHQVLAPGGLLILLEGSSPLRWLDLTFGLTDGWWRFTDDAVRNSYPLISAERWRTILTNGGFTSPMATGPLWADNLQAFHQSIIMARKPGVSNAPAVSANDTWVIFADDRGVGDRLGDMLSAAGRYVIRVHVGSAYDGSTPGGLRLCPSRVDDFHRLFQEVQLSSSTLHDHSQAGFQEKSFESARLAGVVHLWSLDTIEAESLTDAAVNAACERGCQSLLYVTQAILNAGLAELPSLWLATRGAVPARDNGGVAAVAQSPLWGMSRVIAIEHPELSCRRVDLEPRVTTAADDAQRLLDEMESRSKEDQVAFRGAERFVARLARYTVPVPQTSSESPAVEIRPNCSYLITGGCGGLGPIIAEELIAAGARHVLLAGRRQPDSATTAYIERLRRSGATITVRQADVTRRPEMVALITEISSSMPPLRGVIHAVGVLRDAALIRQSWEGFAELFDPKMRGAIYLHELTQSTALDFFVLFSSATALLGNLGQANHAAANAFLGAFAHYRRARGLPALAIDWGAWSERGAVAQRRLGRQFQQRGVGMIPPARGAAIFSRLVRQNPVQVGVIPITWQRFLDGYPNSPFLDDFRHEFTRARSTPRAGDGGVTATSAAERQRLLADLIGAELRSVLGLEPAMALEPNQALIELGLDSITSMELRNRLQNRLQCTLSTTFVFDYPTVDALARHLESQEDPSSLEVRRGGQRGGPFQGASLEPDLAPEPMAPPSESARERVDEAHPERVRHGTLPPPTNWFPYFFARRRPRCRLFCFHYVGGSAAVYRDWQETLPDSIEVCAAQLPGRENRANEPAYSDFPPLIDDLAAVLTPMLNLPFAFYGHCMGALVAFELTHALRQRGQRTPQALLVGGLAAPRDCRPAMLRDDSFRDALIELMEIPPELAGDQQYMETLRQIARHDFQLSGRYAYFDRELMACPLFVFGGTDDPVAGKQDLIQWAQYTNGAFRLEMLPGGHIFLKTSRDRLLGVIARALE